MSCLLTSQLSPPTDESASRTKFHLTEDQIRFFDENGFLILPQRITGVLLEKLQAAAEDWIGQGMAAKASGDWSQDDPLCADYLFAERAAGETMYRVDYLHNKQQKTSLELLGDPRVLAVAESLCGANFVPTYESMVFKQQGDGAAVRWHQDAIHPHRKWRIFNFDLYLDASTEENGALRVIPGSHFDEADICALTNEESWQGPNVVTVEMQPGDVLLHDVMVVHGSPQVASNSLRRTLYYEFRPAEEIEAEGPWDRTWIDRRMRLLPAALRKFQEAFPNAEPFSWNPSEEFRLEESDVDDTELKVAHEVHSRPSFCTAGDVLERTKS